MVTLRPVQQSDITYFSQWWRDTELIKLTSGDTTRLTDAQIEVYFDNILNPPAALHFMIDLSNHTIGHISLQKRDDNWWETQIVIGEKTTWGQGYGVEAIKQLLAKAERQGIHKIYLEVRPDNMRAIKAYQKVGLREVGKPVDTKCKQLPQLLRMELRQQT